MWLSPLSWLLLALAIGLVAGVLGRFRRLLAGLAVLLAGVALAAMTPWVANGLLGWLEKPVANPAWCQQAPPQWAVVLAGGSTGYAGNPGDTQVLGLATRRRLDAGIVWWHRQSGRMLALSGGPVRGGQVADAALMAAYMQRQGVASAAMLVEPRARTTWENATRLAALRPALPPRVVLITSAVHMRRARYAMQQAGFQVCTLATDQRRSAMALPGMVLPQGMAMLKTETALHEIVGMGYYRWLRFRSTLRLEARPSRE